MEHVSDESLRVLKTAIQSELWRMSSLAEQQLFLDDLICSPPRAGDLIAELMSCAGDDDAPAPQRALGVGFCAWLVDLRRAVRQSENRRRATLGSAARLEDFEPTDVRAVD